MGIAYFLQQLEERQWQPPLTKSAQHAKYPSLQDTSHLDSQISRLQFVVPQPPPKQSPSQGAIALGLNE